jgi:hypothetical protein
MSSLQNCVRFSDFTPKGVHVTHYIFFAETVDRRGELPLGDTGPILRNTTAQGKCVLVEEIRKSPSSLVKRSEVLLP